MYVNNIYNGKYDILYLLSADELDFDRIPQKNLCNLSRPPWRSCGKKSWIIPTSCFTEKEGIYVNLEGRPQISRQVKVPISGVRNCWSFFNSSQDT